MIWILYLNSLVEYLKLFSERSFFIVENKSTSLLFKSAKMFVSFSFVVCLKCWCVFFIKFSPKFSCKIFSTLFLMFCIFSWKSIESFFCNFSSRILIFESKSFTIEFNSERKFFIVNFGLKLEIFVRFSLFLNKEKHSEFVSSEKISPFKKVFLRKKFTQKSF